MAFSWNSKEPLLASVMLMYESQIQGSRKLLTCKKVKYTSMQLIREIHSGAETILAHFHYLNKGQSPFGLDWNIAEVPKSVAKVADLDQEQTKFVRYIAYEVQKRGQSIIQEWYTESILTCLFSCWPFNTCKITRIRGRLLVYRADVSYKLVATRHHRAFITFLKPSWLMSVVNRHWGYHCTARNGRLDTWLGHFPLYLKIEKSHYLYWLRNWIQW